jgi:pyruvate kinase
MIGHVPAASAAAGRVCLVAMELSGPKVRTVPLTDGPRVIKLRPTRDKLGRVTAPARCWLTPAENPVPPAHPRLPVLQMPESCLTGLCVEDRIELADTRGARRHLVVETTDEG